ncbi:MAG: hypothetical protein IJU07_06875, partial [Synergistaceae bacterium]|nr:hypothetical protein [Synergistaceae bacterium]
MRYYLRKHHGRITGRTVGSQLTFISLRSSAYVHQLTFISLRSSAYVHQLTFISLRSSAYVH